MRAQTRRWLGRRGNVMVLFTLMLPTLLIPLTGLAIDASIARLVQARLQAAVDGAALGAGRLLGTTADPETVAGEFLAANFRTDNCAGCWGANNLQSHVVYTPGITKTVQIDASADVPLLFMRIFGRDKATVSAGGTATRTDSRVVVVIDRSPSMNSDDKTGSGDTVLTDAKNYATAFVKKFTSGSDELGLVILDSTGLVAYPSLNPSWDPSTTSTSTGGPSTQFNLSTDSNNLLKQIAAIQPVPNPAPNGYAGFTGTADALWTAYIELQKAHLKDLAHDLVDYRLNAIVLLTDGLPQSATVWPNHSTDNALKTGSGGCTNKSSTTNNIIGYIGVSRPFTSSYPQGLYQLESTDPTSSHTTNWYLGTSGAGLLIAPTPNLTGGCTGLYPPLRVPSTQSTNYLQSTSTNDFANIPHYDAWGNDMTGTAYMTASDFVDQNGNPATNQLPSGTVFSQAQPASGTHWSLAFWNAADSAAKRIRQDVNKPNRTPTDPNKIPVTIYVIGYSGNGGLDQGLLKRIANDKTSSSFTNTEPIGLYVPAGNPTALQNAFNTVYQAILRLSR